MASLQRVMREFEGRLGSMERLIRAMAKELNIEVPPEEIVTSPPPRAELKKASRDQAELEEIDYDAFDMTNSARELAIEQGLDPADIKGMGDDGRILKSDVEAAIPEE